MIKGPKQWFFKTLLGNFLCYFLNIQNSSVLYFPTDCKFKILFLPPEIECFWPHASKDFQLKLHILRKLLRKWMYVVNRFRKRIGTLTDVRLFHQTLDKNKNEFVRRSQYPRVKKIIFMDILLISEIELGWYHNLSSTREFVSQFC